MATPAATTPRERFLAALNLEEPDRVPLFYQHLGGAIRVLESCGKTIRAGFQDPQTFAEIALAAHRLFGFDNVMAGWGDLLVEARAHGTQWKFPEKDFYPRVETYAIKSLRDVDSIHPVDPMWDKYWSVPLRAAGLMQQKVGKEIAVVGCANSPTLVTSELMGLEKLLLGMMRNPQEIDKAMGTVDESLKMYADHISRDSGLESIFLEDGSAGAELMSPPLCTKFDAKHLKVIVDHCKSLGLKTIVHNCSARPYLEAQAAIAPAALHFNNKMVDLRRTFAVFRGKLCIISGIDHMELLFRRPPEEVEAEVKRVLNIYGNKRGLMLAPGCEMPFKIPVENVRRFKETVEGHVFQPM